MGTKDMLPGWQLDVLNVELVARMTMRASFELLGIHYKFPIRRRTSNSLSERGLGPHKKRRAVKRRSVLANADVLRRRLRYCDRISYLKKVHRQQVYV